MTESIQGAQLVGRVAAVLRIVSASMPDGTTPTRVAAATGISRPTAHRILASLAEHGFVDRDARTSRWLLGPELYVMGAIAAERYDITPIARESLLALAAATGESAFLSARRGDETVCLLREEGAFPIRSHVLYEGIRFPLGVASAGIAILSFLSDVAVEAHLARVDLAARYGEAHTARAVRERVAATRATGYAVNPGLIVEGSWGMAAAIFDTSGQPAWALSLTGIESRFTAERRPELGRLLLAAAHRVTQEIGGRSRI
ncbi:MAG TPA: IclR family transcriptional regulator [Microbacteriaceae bacterium]|nr:IclR family transcriptional regulator [Microbacteriaceae bacterium]